VTQAIDATIQLSGRGLGSEAVMLPQPVLEFHHVSKRYGNGVESLKDISFTVMPGQMVAFLGESGSGKTTALKMIARLEFPTTGQICMDGKDLVEFEPIALRRSLGYVIQEGGLFPHWTAAENVTVIARMRGCSKTELRECARKAMDLAQIPYAEFGERYPLTLSGGQRQRVAIARSLAGNPRMLLLDEPFSALDPLTRDTLRSDLRNLVRKLNMTALIVTHDVSEAFLLADRIAFLHAGRLLQYDAPEKLLLSPASAQVRSFIGKGSLEARMKHIRLDKLAPYLERTNRPGAAAAVAVPCACTIPQALELIDRHKTDEFSIQSDDGTTVGPFGARQIWALLRDDA
jgi:osmoprotectant transport system ATP-binding protein